MDNRAKIPENQWKLSIRPYHAEWQGKTHVITSKHQKLLDNQKLTEKLA